MKKEDRPSMDPWYRSGTERTIYVEAYAPVIDGLYQYDNGTGTAIVSPSLDWAKKYAGTRGSVALVEVKVKIKEIVSRPKKRRTTGKDSLP